MTWLNHTRHSPKVFTHNLHVPCNNNLFPIKVDSSFHSVGMTLSLIHFVTSTSMGFRRKHFYIICVIYLFMVTGLLAQDNPCASTSPDEVNGVCGLNGICRVSGQSHNCTCPPGFHFVDTETQSKGCTQNTSQLQNCGTKVAKMVAVEQIDWSGNDYQEIRSTNINACQKACIDDCFCTVAIYADLDDGGHCWKKAMPLRNGGASPTRTSFVKVYTGVSEAVPPPPPQQQQKVITVKENKGKGLAVVGISLMGCSLAVVAVVFFVWLLICKPKMRSSKEDHKVIPMGLKAFSYQELEAATGRFKIEIGRGAFGTVYKGVLSDGRAIGVKKLADQLKKENNTRDGEKEFRTEMGVIAASHHKNLVQLYGFCDEGSHRILVYEYMPNGSLDNRLFKGTNYGLDWELRVQILLGIARGILYLHEECRTHIIHCDIKPQNILLDENHCAKISDFGISKLLGVEQTRTFTLARGTMGYMAPEWQKSTAVSVKVDVYSFGVVLLEVICCRKMLQLEVPEEEIMLSDWVYICLKRGRLGKLVEQQECTAVDAKQLERMVLVGLWCVQEDPSLRPSIKKVVQMLEGIVEIPVPPNPGSSMSRSVNNVV